jgi:hypothetical protein
VNLRAEMEQAVSDVGQRHINALLNYGIPAAALAELGSRQAPFGVGLIKRAESGVWWPDDGGVPRLIVPCYERGEIVDLIALHPNRPDDWWHRTGQAVVLGADTLATCVKDRPLEVVSNPLDWMAKAGDAVCVLNWAASYHELSPLRDWPELRVDSAVLARTVRQYLSRPHSIPAISLNLKDQYRDAA